MSYITYPKARVRQMPIAGKMTFLGQAKEYRTELPKPGHVSPPLPPKFEQVTIEIAGKIYSLASRSATPKEMKEVPRILKSYAVAGESLKTWRRGVMRLRDLVLVRIPRFYRFEMPRYIGKVSPDEEKRLHQWAADVEKLWNEAAKQYGDAQIAYDKIMPLVEKMKAEYEAGELSGLGNPDPIAVLTVIIIVAVCVALTTTAVTVWAMSGQLTEAASDMMDASKLAIEELKVGPEGVKAAFDVTMKTLEPLPAEMRAKLATENFKALAQYHIEHEKSVKGAANAAAKTAEQARKVITEGAALSWIKYVPYGLLALMGVIIALSIKDMLTKKGK